MVTHWFRRCWLIALVVAMVVVVSVAPARAQSITTFSIDPRGTFDPHTGQATISGALRIGGKDLFKHHVMPPAITEIVLVHDRVAHLREYAVKRHGALVNRR
jgi:hypothetical protein